MYFIGTATSEMSRPGNVYTLLDVRYIIIICIIIYTLVNTTVALQTKHISTFLAHAQNGLSRLPPEVRTP